MATQYPDFNILTGESELGNLIDENSQSIIQIEEDIDTIEGEITVIESDLAICKTQLGIPFLFGAPSFPNVLYRSAGEMMPMLGDLWFGNIFVTPSQWKNLKNVQGMTIRSDIVFQERGNITDFGTASGRYMILDNNLTVKGDLIVQGSATYIDTVNLSVKDPLVFIASDNTGDILDCGVYNTYTNLSSVVKYSGWFRDATDGVFKIFTNLEVQPTTSVNTSAPSFQLGTLQSYKFIANEITTASLLATNPIHAEAGIDCNNQKITLLQAGTVSTDGVNYGQLTSVISSLTVYLPKTGGTMSGNIVMGGNDISGAGDITCDTFQANTDSYTPRLEVDNFASIGTSIQSNYELYIDHKSNQYGGGLYIKGGGYGLGYLIQLQSANDAENLTYIQFLNTAGGEIGRIFRFGNADKPYVGSSFCSLGAQRQNLDMNGNIQIGLGTGSSATDSINFGQVLTNSTTLKNTITSSSLTSLGTIANLIIGTSLSNQGEYSSMVLGYQAYYAGSEFPSANTIEVSKSLIAINFNTSQTISTMNFSSNWDGSEGRLGSLTTIVNNTVTTGSTLTLTASATIWLGTGRASIVLKQKDVASFVYNATQYVWCLIGTSATVNNNDIDSDFLKKDGTNSMTGTFNLDNNNISNANNVGIGTSAQWSCEMYIDHRSNQYGTACFITGFGYGKGNGLQMRHAGPNTQGLVYIEFQNEVGGSKGSIYVHPTGNIACTFCGLGTQAQALNMGGYQVTNIANGSSANDCLAYSQCLDNATSLKSTIVNSNISSLATQAVTLNMGGNAISNVSTITCATQMKTIASTHEFSQIDSGVITLCKNACEIKFKNDAAKNFDAKIRSVGGNFEVHVGFDTTSFLAAYWDYLGTFHQYNTLDMNNQAIRASSQIPFVIGSTRKAAIDSTGMECNHIRADIGTLTLQSVTGELQASSSSHMTLNSTGSHVILAGANNEKLRVNSNGVAFALTGGTYGLVDTLVCSSASVNWNENVDRSIHSLAMASGIAPIAGQMIFFCSHNQHSKAITFVDGVGNIACDGSKTFTVNEGCIFVWNHSQEKWVMIGWNG